MNTKMWRTLLPALALMLLMVVMGGCALLDAESVTISPGGVAPPADAPAVVEPRAVERIGILCSTLEGNCLEAWNGTDIVMYSDTGSSQTFRVEGSTGALDMESTLDVAGDVDLAWVASADSATTNDTLEIAFTTPVDTTGTNTHNAITVDLGIGNATGGTNTVTGLQIDAITDDAQVVSKAINVGDEWNYAIDTAAPMVATAQKWFDDFLGDEVLGAYTEVSGTDAEAVQAIAVEQFGVYQLTSGDAGTGTAADLEAIHLGLEWQADQGSLVYETRLHLDSATTTAIVCAGLTDDSSTVEHPFTVGGGDAVTSTASDAVAFCYDTDADTDEWFALGVAGDTDATGNGATGTAPTADTYQVLRIEVDAGGADARFYIDGTLVGTLTANAVTATTALSPFVSVDSNDTAASQVVDIDYLFVAADRD